MSKRMYALGVQLWFTKAGQGMKYDTERLARFVGESERIDCQYAAQPKHSVKSLASTGVVMHSFGHQAEVLPSRAVGFREVVLVGSRVKICCHSSSEMRLCFRSSNERISARVELGRTRG